MSRVQLTSTADASTDEFHGNLQAGFLGIKASQDKHWKNVWTVLRGPVLFFFTSDNTCLETHIGTLHLNAASTFHNKEGDLKNGFKFELRTDKKKNKFRVPSLFEREVWRAYVVGVITGKVPDDIILSPDQINEIQSKINCSRPKALGVDFPPPSPLLFSASSSNFRQRRLSEPAMTSFPDDDNCSREGFEPPLDSLPDFPDFPPPPPPLEIASPLIHHRFYPGTGEQTPPSWFFSNCSRELAEHILQHIFGTGNIFGNTLMRISHSMLSSGSYAISKRMQKDGIIAHYEVVRIAGGFKINVENSPAEPMKTLSEVMDYFVQLSGKNVTRLLTTNNLKELGIEYSDYSTKIMATNVDNDSGEEVADSSFNIPEAPALASFRSTKSIPFTHTLPNKKYVNSSSLVNTGPISQTIGVTRTAGHHTLHAAQQRWEEEDAIKKIDNILKKDEVASVNNNRPLPPVPLQTADGLKSQPTKQAIYQNVKESFLNDTGNTVAHPRWQQRSHSLSTVATPAAQESSSGKLGPSVANKLQKVKRFSSFRDANEGSDSLIDELKKALQLGPSALKTLPKSLGNSASTQAINNVTDQSLYCEPVGDNSAMYEDLDHYQNVGSQY